MREQAWQYHRYGGVEVLTSDAVDAPRARGREALVRVHAAALNPKDALFRKGRFRLLSGGRFPKRIGQDFAGVIEAGGDLPAGTRVFGMLQVVRFERGSLATHLVARPGELAPMPDGMGFEEAAAIPLAGLTALQALRDLGHVRAGTRVCVNGASGGVGSFALRIGRALGARVTSISSTRNLELCRSLGADEALAYDRGDPLARGPSWDVFFDAWGNRSVHTVGGALAEGGVYVSTIPSARVLRDQVLTAFSRRRARLVIVRTRRRDLEALGRMWSAGQLPPLIDRVVGWDEVPAAFTHLESKRARGKIVVRVG
jgi:NADPH:quinone reductase-like Zn-dependent oxidoreductase